MIAFCRKCTVIRETTIVLNLPVAFGMWSSEFRNIDLTAANHILIHLVSRFLSGSAVAAAEAVSDGVISDIFPNDQVGLSVCLKVALTTAQ